MRRSTPITDGVKLAVINALNVQSHEKGDRPLKKHSKSSQRSEANLKRTKARGPVQRDAKEVLAEVIFAQLTFCTNTAAELPLMFAVPA
jgi:hypothetical protein